VVLAACSADRKAASDGMRAIFDESGGAIGWRATGSACWPRQLDLAIAGSRGGALALIVLARLNTEEEKTDYSLVVYQQRGKTLENTAIDQMAPTTVSSSVRTREYAQAVAAVRHSR